MSELKATPGPWVRRRGGRIEDANGNTVEATGLALITGYRGASDPAFANAHLIAAAPELYEALSSLLEIQPRPPINESEKWQVRKAKAALTKARGEP